MNNSSIFPSRLKLYWEFVRPFTLLPPALGVLSSGICAWRTRSPESLPEASLFDLRWVLLGAFCAGILNAASNALNQITDFEIDAVNKSNRPLPSGRMSMKEARNLAFFFFVAGLIPAFFIQPYGRPDFFILAFTGFVFTFLYSAKPFRLKRLLGWSNLSIAVPRGCLLLVAGWACVAPVWNTLEPWYLGGILFLFILGASSTKDFSDMEGDREGGCITLPIRFGPHKATLILSPFLTLPWLLLPFGVALKNPSTSASILSGNPWLLSCLGVGLFVYGLYIDYLLLRNPEELTRTENHPSWKHMYLMMMFSQVGLVIAYLFN